MNAHDQQLERPGRRDARHHSRDHGRLLDRRGFEAALPVALVLLAFTAVVHFGRRRSNTLEVMSGTGDERVRSLYTQAVAIAGTVMSFLLPAWWLVTVAQGDPNETLSLLCAIFGVSFILAIVVVARRG